jgi:Uma2 family endonuclease
MTAGLKTEKVTIHEYLSYLEGIEGRAEFYNGVIYDMAGGTDNHSQIGGNVLTALNIALADKPCIVFGADAKLEIETQEAVVMPDVHVMCGERQLSKRGTGLHTNATVVIEVLSPATAAYDRGGKFHRYMLVPDLMEYLLVDQNEPRVDVFKREETGFWSFRSYFGLEEVIKLTSIGVDLPLKAIYAKVTFEPA